MRSISFTWAGLTPTRPTSTVAAGGCRRQVRGPGRGSEPLLAAAEHAYAEGDYRWAAELGKHLLYVNPDNQAARDLQARSFEQLGYQAESAPWRNFYLSGAYELRHGLPEEGFTPVMMLDMLKHTAPERFLDVMATKLDGTAAADSALRINLNFTDSGARFHLWIENAVLHHRRLMKTKSPRPTPA